MENSRQQKVFIQTAWIELQGERKSEWYVAKDLLVNNRVKDGEEKGNENNSGH